MGTRFFDSAGYLLAGGGTGSPNKTGSRGSGLGRGGGRSRLRLGGGCSPSNSPTRRVCVCEGGTNDLPESRAFRLANSDDEDVEVALVLWFDMERCVDDRDWRVCRRV